MKYAILLCVPITLLACAAPKQPSETTNPELESVVSDLALVEDALGRVENRLGHLESEVAASSAANEFTELEIDSVQWGEQDGFAWQTDRGLTLLCHPSEWRGYGKMLRFTRLADPILYLEAEGYPTIQARVATGGLSNEDGSTRFAVLNVPSGLEPGVEYHLRPRNENRRYRWSVPRELVVAAR